jgi:hypothetical protein
VTLPVGPSAIDPGDVGGEQVVLAVGNGEGVEPVREGCLYAGFSTSGGSKHAVDG